MSTPRPSSSRPPGPSTIAAGAALTFETVFPGEDPVPTRLRPHEDTLLRVVSGVVRLQAGDERVLRPGDEAIVPAGTPHRLTGVRDQAVVLSGTARR